eukprot:g12961.t1
MASHPQQGNPSITPSTPIKRHKNNHGEYSTMATTTTSTSPPRPPPPPPEDQQSLAPTLSANGIFRFLKTAFTTSFSTTAGAPFTAGAGAGNQNGPGTLTPSSKGADKTPRSAKARGSFPATPQSAARHGAGASDAKYGNARRSTPQFRTPQSGDSVSSEHNVDATSSSCVPLSLKRSPVKRSPLKRKSPPRKGAAMSSNQGSSAAAESGIRAESGTRDHTTEVRFVYDEQSGTISEVYDRGGSRQSQKTSAGVQVTKLPDQITKLPLSEQLRKIQQQFSPAAIQQPAIFKTLMTTGRDQGVTTSQTRSSAQQIHSRAVFSSAAPVTASNVSVGSPPSSTALTEEEPALLTPVKEPGMDGIIDEDEYSTQEDSSVQRENPQNPGLSNSVKKAMRAEPKRSPQQTASLRKARNLAQEVRLDAIALEAFSNKSGKFGGANTSAMNRQEAGALQTQSAKPKRRALADKTNVVAGQRELLGGVKLNFNATSLGKKDLDPKTLHKSGPAPMVVDQSNGQKLLNPEQPNPPKRTAIILDWDDTLFPTTMLKMQVPQHFVSTPDGVRRAPLNPEFDNYCLHTLGPMVAELLELLLKLSEQGFLTVTIITNAMPDWVQACIERYYPERVRALIQKNIDVLSAREKFFTLKQGGAGGLSAMDAADPLKWKVFTFAGWLGQALPGLSGAYHLVVAGDSPTDIAAGHAMKNMGGSGTGNGGVEGAAGNGGAEKEFAGGPAFVSSIQFIPRPSTRMLAAQLARFSADIRAVIGVNFGLGMSYHLLHDDNALQNRRVAESQKIDSALITQIPVMTQPGRKISFPQLFMEQTGEWLEDASSLNGAGARQRVLGVFEEGRPVHVFQDDDLLVNAEGTDPHRFLYLVQPEEIVYAETIETIMLSRQHLLNMRAAANAS